jgi:hypothetical protein
VLSHSFVRKQWPMRELKAALARPLRDPAATGGGGEGEPVTLLPVLVDGLTVEDLGDAMELLYSPEAWAVSGKSKHERPGDEVLAEWAELLERVSRIVCKREDQARSRPPPHGGAPGLDAPLLADASISGCRPGLSQPCRVRRHAVLRCSDCDLSRWPIPPL